jgi:hypothetical protein
MAGYPPPSLAKWGKAAGVKRITLGFVTARDGSACEPTWGGYKEYPADGSKPYRLADVNKFRSQGGDVVVSFGGQAGEELAAVCSAGELESAYASVIDAYDAKRVDFDIEGAAIQDGAANARRNKAIAQLQSDRPGLRVVLTLPVLPTGLTPDGLALVKKAKAAGVSLSLVNIMAMDYGEDAAPKPEGAMGRLAVSAMSATIGQLEGVFKESVAGHLSVTPMIGINDIPSEIFTLVDARKLRRSAGRVHLGGLSMWQLGRDSKCEKPSTKTQIDCSGVPQQPWAFSQALGD